MGRSHPISRRKSRAAVLLAAGASLPLAAGVVVTWGGLNVGEGILLLLVALLAGGVLARRAVRTLGTKRERPVMPRSVVRVVAGANPLDAARRPTVLPQVPSEAAVTLHASREVAVG